MNFKFLLEMTRNAETFEAIEMRLRNTAESIHDARRKLSVTAKANVYGIEARKARGEIAAIIFGHSHYKGAEVMARQKAINPCYH